MDLKLPLSIEIYLEILQDLNPTVPREMLLIQLESKISHFLCSVGYRINGISEVDTPPNFYGMIFFRSGGGKNRPLSQIDYMLFDNWFKNFSQEYEDWKLFTIKAVEDEADLRYGASKTKKSEYIENNRPRALQRKLGDATPEGFLADRQMLQDFKKGSTYTFISEFGDYILNQSPTRETMLTLLKDAFDMGNTEVKIIKGDREAKAVSDVPSVAMFTTSLRGLMDGVGNNLLNRFLDSGFARRCFVVVPERIPTVTVELYQKEVATLKELKEMRETFDVSVEAIANNPNKLITISTSALNLYYEWRARTYNEATLIDDETEQVDRETSYWKVLKLAAIFAVWDGRNVINKGDLECAISQYDFCFAQISKILNPKDKSVEKLYALLKEKPRTKSELRALKIVGNNRFRNWLFEAIGDIEEMAQLEGYKLREAKIGKNGIKYGLFKSANKLLLEALANPDTKPEELDRLYAEAEKEAP